MINIPGQVYSSGRCVHTKYIKTLVIALFFKITHELSPVWAFFNVYLHCIFFFIFAAYLCFSSQEFIVVKVGLMCMYLYLVCMENIAIHVPDL